MKKKMETSIQCALYSPNKHFGDIANPVESHKTMSETIKRENCGTLYHILEDLGYVMVAPRSCVLQVIIIAQIGRRVLPRAGPNPLMATISGYRKLYGGLYTLVVYHHYDQKSFPLMNRIILLSHTPTIKCPFPNIYIRYSPTHAQNERRAKGHRTIATLGPYKPHISPRFRLWKLPTTATLVG